MSLDIGKLQFLDEAAIAAEMARHLFPHMAAAEAALESAFGKSGLAILGNNLFGMKQHQHPIYGTVNLPTREFLDHQWVKTTAAYVKYPSKRECFQDRVATLQRMAPHYPHYAAALDATTPEIFVTEVSKTWATDPMRATHVIALYHEYMNEKSAQKSN